MAIEPGTEIALSDHSPSLPSSSLPSPSSNGSSKKKKTKSDPLFAAFKEAFVSKDSNRGRDWNWKIQGTHINKLAARCRKQSGPIEYAIRLLEKFWTLIQTGDKFWKSQPFTPSTLNSEGIYTRVVKAMTVEQGLDIAAIVGDR